MPCGSRQVLSLYVGSAPGSTLRSNALYGVATAQSIPLCNSNLLTINASGSVDEMATALGTMLALNGPCRSVGWEFLLRWAADLWASGCR